MRFYKGAKAAFVAMVVVILGNFWVMAESTSVKGLFHHTLDNGLELFVVENDNVPLVYAEVAVRCGAFTQTPDTAGLFHLYEHMMFKGNNRFQNAATLSKALSNMGAGDWNGATDVDCVNYYVTVPATLLENVVEFWASVIRTPLILEEELANEKRVVLAEIKANAHIDERSVRRYQCEKLFSDAPWTTDPSGSEKVVEKATRDTLCAIQNEYYVSKNTALFIGGNVKDETVLEVVKKFFGDWGVNKVGGVETLSKTEGEGFVKDETSSINTLGTASDNVNNVLEKGTDSEEEGGSTDILTAAKSNLKTESLDTPSKANTNKKKSKKEKVIDIGKSSVVFHHSDEPLATDISAYMPYKKLSSALVQITSTFRGPDAYFCREDTYTADVLALALSNPELSFVKELESDKDIGTLGSDYVWVSFPTSLNSAVFTFGVICASSGKSIVEKTEKFNEKITEVFSNIKKYISEEELKAVSTRLLDEDLIKQDSAQEMLSTIRFWWSHADADYYFDYKKRIANVTLDDLQAFCDKYFLGKHRLSVVLANPQICKEQSSRFRFAKFEKIK